MLTQIGQNVLYSLCDDSKNEWGMIPISLTLFPPVLYGPIYNTDYVEPISYIM